MSKRTEKHGSYLSNSSVHELNEVHGWFSYEDAQSDVSRAFANNAIHAFIESAKEAEIVKQESGLTPRQLLQQRAELLEALKNARKELEIVNELEGEEPYNNPKMNAIIYEVEGS